MTITVLDQNTQKTTFLNSISPDDVLNVSHERVKSKVLGVVVPVTRINFVNSQSKPFTLPNCTDGCAIPGETVETVRIVISGPVANKTAIVATLKEMVFQLESAEMANVWLGLPVNPTVELPIFVGE